MNQEVNDRLPFLDVMTLGSGTSFVTTIIQNLTLQVKGFLRNGGNGIDLFSRDKSKEDLLSYIASKGIRLDA